jgi:hypothetical protein
MPTATSRRGQKRSPVGASPMRGKVGVPASEIHDAIDDLNDFMVGAIEGAEERDQHADKDETEYGARVLVDPQSIEDAEEDALKDDEDEQR